jgi:DNA-binding GntR family transcriptional regulator
LKSLTETTVDRIRQAIVSGEFALGSKLSEQRLADTLGVSRSPARDALAVLQAEGLVNVFPKRGSFVFTPELRDVDELCEHRQVLEVAAIRMSIARNRTPLLEALTHAAAEMQTAMEAGDYHAFTLGDLAFHRAIVDNCDNRYIIRTYDRTISPIKALRTHLFTIMNAGAERALSEHLALVAACRANDPDAAATLLAEHVGHLVEAFRTVLSGNQNATPQTTAG